MRHTQDPGIDPLKADLHLHSCHSQRAPEWLFRRAGMPDSYSDPATLHDLLRARGMDFVTLTDHDSIAGCSAIADRPGTFLSVQVSARFPESRCPVHVLVWGLSEAQHGDLQGLRDNIHDIQGYLFLHKLAHAVAHPLYRLDERFTPGHLEKLLLLFRHFEGLNGHRDALLSAVITHLAGHLTPAGMERLAEKHRLAPTHPEPWRKVLCGGSDDHSGLHAGRACTETPAAGSVTEFLDHVREGRCTPVGEGGTPLAFSHGLYNNVRHFIGKNFAGGNRASLIEKAFSRFMEGENPTEFSLMEKINFVAQGIATGKIFELAKPAHASLWRQFASAFAESDVKSLLAQQTDGILEPERRAFVIANFFANRLVYRLFLRFVQQVSSGNIIEAIQEISTLLPIAATLAPYLYAFGSQSPDRPWLAALCHELQIPPAPPLQNRKRAWFTDTLEDVNGVANTIRRLTEACVADGCDLVVVTSRELISITGIPIRNFPPIGEFELPEYELQKLSFPPVLEMLDYIRREGFTELIISTPGPVGITALIAGKLFGLRTSGIYHTDFPQYVRILSDDTFLETLAWNYMHWFYDQHETLYVNSEGYRQAWEARGIAPEKLKILPRGLDTALFSPHRRDPQYWVRRGVPTGNCVLLYVGRISKEKNLDVIADAWAELHEEAATLAFVGDGPFVAELRARLPHAIFTGVLAGLELAQAFASADLFLFPSVTDTFGNVVLEALASGLPNVVSDEGGPKDLIEEGVTGHITRALDARDFAAGVRRLVHDPAARARMSEAARKSVSTRDWAEAGRQFWAQSAE